MNNPKINFEVRCEDYRFKNPPKIISILLILPILIFGVIHEIIYSSEVFDLDFFLLILIITILLSILIYVKKDSLKDYNSVVFWSEEILLRNSDTKRIWKEIKTDSIKEILIETYSNLGGTEDSSYGAILKIRMKSNKKIKIRPILISNWRNKYLEWLLEFTDNLEEMYSFKIRQSTRTQMLLIEQK